MVILKNGTQAPLLKVLSSFDIFNSLIVVHYPNTYTLTELDRRLSNLLRIGKVANQGGEIVFINKYLLSVSDVSLRMYRVNYSYRY